MKRAKGILFFFVLAFLPLLVFAETEASSSGHGEEAVVFLWIAVLLILAKISSLVERFGQPAVLGEILVGVALGNLGLLGIHVFEPILSNNAILFLAELGVVILLFQIGLESNINKMKETGTRAFLVAVVGVAVPFVLGAYLVGPWFFPGLSKVTYLFLGAALTATSVGITARVFQDLGKLHIPEAQIVLGAAVIDDVLGLIILAIVSAIAATGAVSAGGVAWIVFEAIIFLVGAIFIGQVSAPALGKLFSRIHTGFGMKFTLALSFGLIFAYAADAIGLAPIVGAFAAGLVLDPVHFKAFKKPKLAEVVGDRVISRLDQKTREEVAHHAERHIDELIEPLGYFLVPLFFVLTGMAVKLDVLFDKGILLLALGITIAAFIGKIVAGLVAGDVNKWLVGWGMVPRGEVGLIFATTGKALGVVNNQIFSVIIVMVIISTLLTPPVITHYLKREKKGSKGLSHSHA